MFNSQQYLCILLNIVCPLMCIVCHDMSDSQPILRSVRVSIKLIFVSMLSQYIGFLETLGFTWDHCKTMLAPVSWYIESVIKFLNIPGWDNVDKNT